MILVHVGGFPLSVDLLKEVRELHPSVHIIEDCAQAHGAHYDDGSPVGMHADVAAWSFCQDKLISTGGEGGAVTTNSNEIADRVWRLKDHGRDRELMSRYRGSNDYSYIYSSFGSNGRMTAAQAAIGWLQIKKSDDWWLQRKANLSVVKKIFEDIPQVRLLVPKRGRHAMYRMYFSFDDSVPHETIELIRKELEHSGCPLLRGSCPLIPNEPVFRNLDREKIKFPQAEKMGSNTFCFPLYHTIPQDTLVKYFARVKTAIEKYS
jgi:dTDP-4-amino-4,6-dideoxygalactose transaminase